MKALLFSPVLILSLWVWCVPNDLDTNSKFDPDKESKFVPDKDSKLEFSKQVYKVKGVINKADGDVLFVIMPQELKGTKFVPTYLPEEYKKKGLEVTFDGELGKADKSGTPLNLHKIWVAYEIKEKFKLAHKNYYLN